MIKTENNEILNEIASLKGILLEIDKLDDMKFKVNLKIKDHKKKESFKYFGDFSGSESVFKHLIKDEIKKLRLSFCELRGE